MTDHLGTTNSEKGRSKKKSFLGGSVSIVCVMFIGMIMSQSAFPTVPGRTPLPTIVFWTKTSMQLMGFIKGNTYPRNSEKMSYDPPKKNLVALPNEIDASKYKENPQGLTDRIKELGWPSEPIVIRKVGQSRPDVFHNLLDYNVSRLEQVYGNFPVAVFQHMAYVKSAIKMPFVEYTKKMTDKSRRLYARAIPDEYQIVKNSVNDTALAQLLGMSTGTVKLTKSMGRKYGSAQIFAGSNHVWSSAHCDIGTSAFFMIQGRKRWVFYGPSETPFIYPYGQFRNVAYSTGVDVFRPDYEESPLFEQARGYEVTIDAGDMLIFPSLWWHAVQNLDEQTVGVDIPALDLIGSFRRNTVMTVASVFNPRLWFTSLSAYTTGRNLRDVFFMGYLASDDDEHLQQALAADRSKVNQ